MEERSVWGGGRIGYRLAHSQFQPNFTPVPRCPDIIPIEALLFNLCLSLVGNDLISATISAFHLLGEFPHEGQHLVLVIKVMRISVAFGEGDVQRLLVRDPEADWEESVSPICGIGYNEDLDHLLIEIPELLESEPLRPRHRQGVPIIFDLLTLQEQKLALSFIHQVHIGATPKRLAELLKMLHRGFKTLSAVDDAFVVGSSHISLTYFEACALDIQ